MRLALIVLPLLPACATIVTPWEFDVPITSEPAGATVLVGNEVVGVTPCVAKFSRTEGPELRLQLDGYHEQTVRPGNDPPPVGLIAIDILLFPFAIVDLITSAPFAVHTGPVQVHMTKASEPAPPIWHRADYDPEYRGRR